jgi:hypothetical protein
MEQLWCPIDFRDRHPLWIKVCLDRAWGCPLRASIGENTLHKQRYAYASVSSASPLEIRVTYDSDGLVQRFWSTTSPVVMPRLQKVSIGWGRCTTINTKLSRLAHTANLRKLQWTTEISDLPTLPSIAIITCVAARMGAGI